MNKLLLYSGLVYVFKVKKIGKKILENVFCIIYYWRKFGGKCDNIVV